MKSKIKKVNILIPNATSPRNMGDFAILQSLLNLLSKSYKSSKITIHSIDPSLYNFLQYEVTDNFYNWAVFRSRNVFIRIINLLKIIAQVLIVTFGLEEKIVLDKKLKAICQDYKSAQVIIFVGGGYLRSRSGFNQTLNLAMITLPFAFSKLFSTKTIVAPISFGPFAYRWQEAVVAKVLKAMDIVSVREEISFRKLRKYGLKNMILSVDHALLTEYRNSKRKNNRNPVFGFTVRHWGEKDRFREFEKSFIDAVTAFSKKTNALVKPIVQVDAPMYGENDTKATKKIEETLIKDGVKVLSRYNQQNLDSLLDTYSKIDLLLGMRMHSNIFASTQKTPFVAIAYEHKTEGITRQLGLAEYNISFEDVNKDKLYRKLVKAYKNRNATSQRMFKLLTKIQKKETKKWINLFNSIAS